jgi:mono/diheme cytochrome c family protein
MTSYSRPNAPPLDGGSPGQSDGSGDLIPKLLVVGELQKKAADDPIRRFLTQYYPEMPYRNATVTDNLSVWRQADRPYGQLDGSIRAPIVRNVAAQTAVVGSPLNLNVANADICARFTAHLPAPPYPFAVDMVRARRGEALFAQHCAACHRVGNGTVYTPDQMGTDTNRARVLGPEGKDLLVRNFLAGIPKDYVATAADGTTYKPAELGVDDIINDRARPDHQGYVAGPLDGIWARAPYLHNGSVPTLRHLLAPSNPESRRPSAFVRGVVSYDTLNVGFDWDVHDAAALVKDAPTAVIFDTGWDGASNRGHDRDIVIDGQRRRLDWSGPESRTDLEDLLEYLKTL